MKKKSDTIVKHQNFPPKMQQKPIYRELQTSDWEILNQLDACIITRNITWKLKV